MKKFALIGRDIQESFSPFIHNYCFKELSLDAQYNIIDISEPSDLSNVIELLKSKKLDGINVTTPYKKDFIPYLDETHTGLGPKTSGGRRIWLNRIIVNP